MAILKFFGAEAGDIEETPGTTIAGMSADTVISPNSGGAYSFKNDGTATTNHGMGGGFSLSAVYMALRFRGTWSSTPGTSVMTRLGSMFDSNSTGLGWILLRHNSTGTNSWSVYFVNGATSQIASNVYTFTLTSGTWLDIEYSINANGGWVKLNGTTVLTLNSANALWTAGTMIYSVSGLSK